MSLLSILFLISLFSLYTHPTFSQTTTCKSLKLSQTFANCQDLPTLSAVLHWTYNPSNSSLSVAFTASPPNPDGWVAWGLNPNGTGMFGGQVILANKPSSSSSVTVNTYNLTSTGGVIMGPISYKVTSLSAQDSSGVITIFGTWAVPKGASKLNQIWQVGPMVNGNVGRHEFGQANLGSKLELSLTSAGAPGASPVSPPAGAPGPSPSSHSGASGASPAGAPGASPPSPSGASGASPAGAPGASPTGVSPVGDAPPSSALSPPSPSAPGDSPAGAPPPSGSTSSPSGASGDAPSAPQSSPPSAGERLVSGFLALGAMLVYFLF